MTKMLDQIIDTLNDIYNVTKDEETLQALNHYKHIKKRIKEHRDQR